MGSRWVCLGIVFGLSAGLLAQPMRDLRVEELDEMRTEQRVALLIGNSMYEDSP